VVNEPIAYLNLHRQQFDCRGVPALSRCRFGLPLLGPHARPLHPIT
jgi:hypothetical protein